MKKSILSFLSIVTVFFAAAVSANATPTGFNGKYDYSTWSKSSSDGSDTTSYIDASQQTLTMMEPDNAYMNGDVCYFSGDGCAFNFSHVVYSSGTVSFNWAFDWGVDACCSGFNFYINSTLYNLADGYPANPYNENGASSGYFTASVNAGDTITFSAFSADACCGAASTTITNFDAPTSEVPEPASVVLFGTAAVGLRLARRKKFAKSK